MNILDLPAEILADILSRCPLPAASLTCSTFATIIYGTSSLWTSVHIHPHQDTLTGPEILRVRISRAKGALLDVSFGIVREHTVEVAGLCKVLAEYNAQIRRLELTGEHAFVAGAVVGEVFPGEGVHPAVEELSVRSQCEGEPYEYEWPRLDKVLADAPKRFPGLRTLHINSFYDNVPVPPLSPVFGQLTTLVLDGAKEEDIPTAGLLAALLNCTPELETLWMKHHFWESFDDVSQPTAWGSHKGRGSISLDIRLPRLRHLAVSVPGTACQLMGCITAPVLEDLHLDGSRGLVWEDPVYEWKDWMAEEVQSALRLFAARCKSVKRLAVTQTYLPQTGWDWVFFGGREGPPFPRLECIALHGICGYSNEVWNGFEDELLQRFACEPRIPLRRVVLMNCELPVCVSSVVAAFRASRAKENLELECDEWTPKWDENEAVLEALGVALWCREEVEVVEDKWWIAGHGIDGTDNDRY